MRITIHIDCLILTMLKIAFQRAYNKWALREINPLHPDLPGLVLARQELKDKAAKLKV